MARTARIVVPGVPHHITQRGNRRQRTFFRPQDYVEYRTLLATWCRACGVEIWAYCLMPNHVHLIAVPERTESLARGIGEAHRRYTRAINFRKRWRGYLWQGRFASFPMDEPHTLAAARYIERNPVAAGLVTEPAAYPWSSARAHVRGQDDALVRVAPLLGWVDDWQVLLADREVTLEPTFARHERTGRPLGSVAWIEQLEQRVGRRLRPRKVGRKPTSRPK